jgi:hypothetical protein
MLFYAALGEFLLGASIGLGISALAMADEELTAGCVHQAQRRLDYLRDDADRRVAGVYQQYSGWMSPAVRRAYEARLGASYPRTW